MSTINVTTIQHESGSGNNIVLDSDGNVEIDSNIYTTSISGTSPNSTNSASGFRANEDGLLFYPGDLDSSNNPVLSVQTDGSARFRVADGSGVTISETGVAPTSQVSAKGFRINKDGIYGYNDGGAGSNSAVLQLTSTGAIIAAGTISTGDVSSTAVDGDGVRLRNTGDISIRKDGGNDSVFQVFQDGDGTDDRTVQITNEGAAFFKGAIEVDREEGTNTGVIIRENGTARTRLFADGKINAGGEFNGTTARLDSYLIVGDASGGTQINSALDRVNNGNGTLQVKIGTATIQTTSDIRLKNQLRSTPLNATEKLNQVEIFDFTWKGDDIRNNRGQWTGFSAQQLHEVLPFCVHTPTKEDGSVDYEMPVEEAVWCIDSTGLLPVLVKALQEQSSRIEALEAKIQQLEA